MITIVDDPKESTITPEELAENKGLITDIMHVVKLSNVPKSDEILLALAFRSTSELKKIARELHIKVA